MSASRATPHVSRTARPLHGKAQVPGDKSISHRALILGAQNLGTTIIHGLLEGEDVLNTADAVTSLGARAAKTADGRWQVTGVGVGGLSESDRVLDMGNSGTGARLVMGLAASYPFTTFFTGDASLRKRPMGRVTTPLAQMGTEFMTRSGGRLPLAMKGASSPLPITYTLPVPSAQVKSAILLAALNTPGKTTVIEPEPTRDHTEIMLRALGVKIETEMRKDGSYAITLTGQPDIARKKWEITVPADPSSAAFLAVAALIVPGSDITLTGVCLNPLRTGLYETLREMGANITYQKERKEAGERVADLRVRHSALKGVKVPATRAPSMIDEYPILAVAAAFAKGKTVMQGLEELRVKESDRLAAMAKGLEACGVKVEADNDSLTVSGKGAPPPGGATIATGMDHRIAMAFLTLGMASRKEVRIDDAGMIATSFPGFVELCNRLGAAIAPLEEREPEPISLPKRVTKVRPMVIAIDGPAASGKGTLARRLADHFGFAYLDTGSLYRAVGLRLIYSDQDPKDEAAAVKAAKSITQNDLTNPRLRQERVGNAASVVSASAKVRKVLLDFQRRYAKRPEGAVLDGRDIGTVVCPKADLKIFMTASLEARARRRHRELQGQGIEVVYESVLEDLKERDKRDSRRKTAPLKPAKDAIHIDTTHLDANSVFERVSKLVEERG